MPNRKIHELQEEIISNNAPQNPYLHKVAIASHCFTQAARFLHTNNEVSHPIQQLVPLPNMRKPTCQLGQHGHTKYLALKL